MPASQTTIGLIKHMGSLVNHVADSENSTLSVKSQLMQDLSFVEQSLKSVLKSDDISDRSYASEKAMQVELHGSICLGREVEGTKLGFDDNVHWMRQAYDSLLRTIPEAR